MTERKKVITISLRQDQIQFLDEFNAVSKVSKSEIIRQCLDRAAPDLMGALEAMKKHGFRPATKTERKQSNKRASKSAQEKWNEML